MNKESATIFGLMAVVFIVIGLAALSGCISPTPSPTPIPTPTPTPPAPWDAQLHAYHVSATDTRNAATAFLGDYDASLAGASGIQWLDINTNDIGNDAVWDALTTVTVTYHYVPNDNVVHTCSMTVGHRRGYSTLEDYYILDACRDGKVDLLPW